MKIELKNVKLSPAMSQESLAYTADIWVNGISRGTVRNQGTGGMDLVDPPDLREEIEAYAKTLPSEKVGTLTLPQSPDSIFMELMTIQNDTQNLQKMMRSKTLFTFADNKVKVMNGKGKAPAGATNVLNTMAFDQALKLYRDTLASK